MRVTFPLRSLTVTGLCALALAGCGGGGGGNSDVTVPPSSSTPPAVQNISGPNSFLLFPNPQIQADGTVQTDTTGYAQAYYRAVDPTAARATLQGWLTANGFGSPGSTDMLIIFADTRDLGYGRRITAHRNADGTLAFYVENYLVGGLSSYGTPQPALNLQAAIERNTQWLVEVNAIEWSPAAPSINSQPVAGISFPKFYVYDTNGNQRLTGTLDDRGQKALPGVCVTCHGGRGDALTPPDTAPGRDGLPAFPIVWNGASQARGDVQAHLQPVNVDRVVFDTAGNPYDRAHQEANIKTMNEWILCSYPLGPLAQAQNDPVDGCRRLANGNEWDGDTASDFIKTAYGGVGLPSPTFNDTQEDVSWPTNGADQIYQNVVKDQCRVCHELRGTAHQSDLDLSTYSKFVSYANYSAPASYLDDNRIQVHSYNRGNMPLAEIIYKVFWASETNNPATQLANFLAAQGATGLFDSGGNVLQPGRPVADPGPDRALPTGAFQLSGSMSLFSSTYAWSIVSGPAGATLTNANTINPTFTSTQNGTYQIQLVTTNGSTSSTPATLTIVVNSAFTDPTTVRWAQVKGMLQSAGCTACHVKGGIAPVPYTDEDRNFDGVVDANPGGLDDMWEYAEVRGRVNFADIAASPLLRKPSGHHHGGGVLPQPNYDGAGLPPGDPGRANYDLVLDWILNGAPY